MSIGTLTQADQAKIKHVIGEGVKTAQEIDDLKGSLSDLVKAVAEELDIPAKALNAAIRAAFKDTLDTSKEHLTDVEELLAIAGRR